MKKILFIFVLLGVLTASFAFAMPLENTYPVIGNTTAPTSTRTSLPTFIKYLFNIALIAAAFIAFGALVFGGIKYLTSAGNTSQTGIAKDMIFSAFLGLGILLLSWLLLGTINPQLVSIGSVPVVVPGTGVTVTFDNGESIVYQQSVGSLDGVVKKIDFEQSKYNVIGYSQKNWGGTKKLITSGNQSDVINSLEISPKMPGVYLCYTEGASGIEVCRAYTGGTPNFGDNKSKYTKIKIFDQIDELGNTTKRYDAILFEKENYGFGGVDIYESDVPIVTGFAGPARDDIILSREVLNAAITNNWASSIAVISYDPRIQRNGLANIYSQRDMGGTLEKLGEQSTMYQDIRTVDNEVRSIDLQGNIIAILCDTRCTRSGSNPDLYAGSYKCEDNKCQIFDKSNAPDSDLTNDPIGTCRAAAAGVSLPWITNLPCASYYILKSYDL